MRIITLILAVFVCAAVTYADTEVGLIVVSDDDVNAQIECYGASCTYNLYNGNVTIPDGASYNVTQNSFYYDIKSGSGASMKSIAEQFQTNLYRFYNGKSVTRAFQSLLESLNSFFVSHLDLAPTLNNVEYDAHRLDEVIAKINILESRTGAFDASEVELKAALEKSRRINQQVNLSNGIVCDYQMFAGCVRLEMLYENATG